MDTWLTVASRREVREYADRELPEDAVRTILDAGRLAGSSKNRNPGGSGLRVTFREPGAAA
jgi:nitroreductase